MKGVAPLVGYTLILVITISAIFIALQMGRPAIDREKEILLMQEGKSNLLIIGGAVKIVTEEGEGSTRLLKLTVTDGNYFIDAENDAIIFSMESMAQIIGVNVSKIEDDINIFGEQNKIFLNLSYSDKPIDIIGQGDFGRGKRSLAIRNNGYNTTTEKQMVNVLIT